MANKKQTSRKIAKIAATELRSDKTPKNPRRVAGSAVSQAKGKKGPKK